MSNMSDITTGENKLSDIILKVKKITEALYRITDFFPDEEPLKWALRKDAVEIFNSFLAAKGNSNYERNRMTRRVSATIYKTLNLIELASLGSFIARSNFDVLEREYKSALTLITELKLDETDSVLNSELMPVRSETLISSPFFNLRSAKNEPTLKNDEKISDVNDNLVKPVDEIKKDHDGNLHYGGRHAKILSLVKAKKEVSISDIHPHFNGVSEKTIQRDLVSLVNRGLLNVNGDKRWRRYALAIASKTQPLIHKFLIKNSDFI